MQTAALRNAPLQIGTSRSYITTRAGVASLEHCSITLESAICRCSRDHCVESSDSGSVQIMYVSLPKAKGKSYVRIYNNMPNSSSDSFAKRHHSSLCHSLLSSLPLLLPPPPPFLSAYRPAGGQYVQRRYWLLCLF